MGMLRVEDQVVLGVELELELELDRERTMGVKCGEARRAVQMYFPRSPAPARAMVWGVVDMVRMGERVERIGDPICGWSVMGFSPTPG